MNKVQVCKSKTKYYNEVSAARAVDALSWGHKTKFKYYRCGDSKHFHLTHADPKKSIGHGNKLIPKHRFEQLYGEDNKEEL